MSVVDPTVSSLAKSALPGLARALVEAGKLSQPTAEALYQKAIAGKTNFIAELTGSGAVSAFDLAHTMSAAFAAPLLDLDAIDVQRLPQGLIDTKISVAYRLVVLSKRGNRLVVATADPADLEAAEKIKFSTRLGVDWVIAEYDKLSRMVDANATSAAEAINNLIGDDFQFDDIQAEAAATDLNQLPNNEVDDAPVVRFLHKMLMDAFNMRASRPALRALRTQLPHPLPG